MVIADPFGSWVTGAKEGLNSAIALRNAQDEAAQRAYNLQTQAQFDPLRYRLAQNQAATSDLELGANQDIYGSKQPQQMAAEALKHAQLTNEEIPANYGIYGPLTTGIAKTFGGNYYSGSGTQGQESYQPPGVQFPITGPDGQVHYISTPFPNVQNANMYRYQDLNNYRYETALQREEREQRMLEAQQFRETHGGVPLGQPDYMQLPRVPTPAVTPPVQPVTQMKTQPGTLPNMYKQTYGPTGDIITNPVTQYSPVVNGGPSDIAPHNNIGPIRKLRNLNNESY